jgi:hypothetical protein
MHVVKAEGGGRRCRIQRAQSSGASVDDRGPRGLAVKVNDPMDRLDNARRGHTLVGAVDVKMQRAVGQSHHTNSVTNLDVVCQKLLFTRLTK